MKKVWTYFPVTCLMFLSIIANAQNSESFMNVNLDKTTLTYNTSPDLILWENIAGQSGDINKTKSLDAVYNLTERQIIINGTKANGDVEVWDVNGNTIAEKKSGNEKTVLKTKAMPHGTYYISYSNGNYSEGLKLSIR
jgi:hypothetical protein